jgi:glutaredoxin
MIAYVMVESLGKSNRLGYRTTVSESTEPNGGSGSRVVVYSRADCCLCEEALAEVERARHQRSFALEVVDVDRDPDLAARFGHEVPVVEVDGRKAFKFRLTAEQLLRRLRRAGT